MIKKLDKYRVHIVQPLDWGNCWVVQERREFLRVKFWWTVTGKMRLADARNVCAQLEKTRNSATFLK